MEVASHMGVYGSISQELRGGGGGAAMQLWPKWLLGQQLGCGYPRGWGPGGCPEAGLVLGWELGAQPEGTGEGRSSSKDWA